MAVRRFERSILLPIACALLAVLLRIWIPANHEAAAPWLAGSRAVQGIAAPGESGPSRTDLATAIPLIIVENASYLAARIAGETAGASAGVWIRAHRTPGTVLLRLIWMAAAAAAAFALARIVGGWWGALAGVLAASVPIGLVGTQRLEAWEIASLFLLLAFVSRRRVPGVIGWSLATSFTPLAWIAAAAGLILGGRERRLQILMSLPVWFALVPGRLLAPGDAVAAIPAQIAAAGWPGWGDGAVGGALTASWTPGIVVLACGLVAWMRHGADRAVLLAIALLWTVPALLGARRPDAIGLVAPAAIAAGVLGAEEIVSRARRGRDAIGVVLAVLLVVPVMVGSLSTTKSIAGRRDRTEELARLLAREVGSTGLLARDPDAPAPDDSIACFTLPKNADRADAWDFSWWPGWYGDFTHLLIRAGTVDAIERDPAARPIGRMMLAALSRHARRVAIVGDPVTERSAVILFRLDPGPPWSAPDRASAWKSVPANPEAARFVGDLAAFLSGVGRTGSAVELLRLALSWDGSNPRLWNNLGSSLLRMNEPKEAADAFGEGLRRDPQSVELRYGLARAYLLGKIPGRAEVELRRVLAARPDFAGAHYEMARIAASKEDWAEAARALETYLALEPHPADRAAVEAALAEARRRAAAGAVRERTAK